MSGKYPGPSISKSNYNMKMPKGDGSHSGGTEAMPGSHHWINGLICAFELVGSDKKKIGLKSHSNTRQIDDEKSMKEMLDFGLTETHYMETIGDNLTEPASCNEKGSNHSNPLFDHNTAQTNYPLHRKEKTATKHWIPIGWTRISELVQLVQSNPKWESHEIDFLEDEVDLSVADLAAPYWEKPAGPTWWCHVSGSSPFINTWLSNAQWLHPAISVALRDESRLISERMRYLLYEVPVRVDEGILFEILGHSVGDPNVDEDDVPVVIRSWQAQNFLITALHVKGLAPKVNVLGIIEVQELLYAGGYNAPRTVHELISHIACRLSRWDDRLFRKHIFGVADEIELKFMNRRNHEDMNLFSVILDQEIKNLSRQVIRVKWSLHAREEIVFELLQHLRGNTVKILLEGIRKSTREMVEEQEAVRGRLFTIQDVMQSTVRSWLQDRSLRVTHNLAVFGGCGLVLSIITGLFGINVDGIPGSKRTPYAFGLFVGMLILVGGILAAMGLIYLGLKKPPSEEQVGVRMVQLDDLVKLFQYDAENHVPLRKSVSRRRNIDPFAARSP